MGSDKVDETGRRDRKTEAPPFLVRIHNYPSQQQTSSVSRRKRRRPHARPRRRRALLVLRVLLVILVLLSPSSLLAFSLSRGGANGLVRSLTLGPRAFSGGAVLGYVSSKSGRAITKRSCRIKFEVILSRVAKSEAPPRFHIYITASVSQPPPKAI